MFSACRSEHGFFTAQILRLVLLGLFSGGLAACQSGGTARDSAGRPGEIHTRGVVAADHYLGSQAGVEMLRLGGNAVDAAVAASFCQAVVRPYSCGLGGGGFMMIRLKRAVGEANNTTAADSPASIEGAVALVYRETAPAAVGPNFYVDLGIKDGSRYGPYAAGVPGTVAGLLNALADYGKLERATVLGPAIRAAEDGFIADADYVKAAESVLQRFRNEPELVERLGDDSYSFLRRTFLMDGEPRVGGRIVQPELARTLRLLAKYGASVFYAGEIADAIAARCPQISRTDLERYQVVQVPPLRGEAFGYTFLTMPPPSSGGVALQQLLGILARNWDREDFTGPSAPEYIHLLIEAMKHAFADRAEWLADPQFVTVPIAELTSAHYLDELAQRFDPTQTFPLEAYGSRVTATQLPADHGTSHLSVLDQWGNAVACTETINLAFGSLFVIPEYGIIMNNEMDDFLTIPGTVNAFGLTQSERNLPSPGKRPLSSMSPTIVLSADGEVVAIAGASGGPRIITGTLQVLLNTLLYQLDAATAVGLPRLHHQWQPNVVYLETGWGDAELEAFLTDRGHVLRRRERVGNVQLIRRNLHGEGYEAVSDPRKGGAPAGVKD